VPLSDAEFDAILTDCTKLIEGDIVWQEDEDHSPSLEFKLEIATAGGWPLFMKGTYNPLVPAISYALISKTSGRIYALDLGKGHKNPDGGRVGDTHKHRWSEEFKDKKAYEPGDITATPDNPMSTSHDNTASAVCTAIRSGLGPMFECSVNGDFVRVRTPYLYPDGDLIDLFLKSAHQGVTTVSDLGETVRWLNSNTLSAKRSPKQAGLISDISQTHGVEFFRGMLKARSNEPAELADAVTRVSQAAVRVSDLIFTSRLRSIESVSDEVADFLQELHLPFERNKRLIGRSGKNWKIDFQVSAPQRSSLISVLSSGSRSAAQQITKSIVASWYDLSQYRASPEPLSFISLIDDSADVWSDEDFNLVESISNVARWSVPETLTQLLTA
jgi:hypothetical protein